MRIHTDVLTLADITAATRSHGMRGVYVQATKHGSRSRSRSWDVYLTGTASRRTNSGNGGAGDDYAATWDEWGMFLAALFEIDPNAIAGTVKRPTYAGAWHFHAVTRNRFEMLTAPYQHGGGGHRWDYRSAYADGPARVIPCAYCEAEIATHVDPAPFLARLTREA